MANLENYDDLIIGSGIAGKFTAWTRDSRRRMAIVERGLLGGACPNVACLPSKNIIWSAKVISLARRGAEFGVKTESVSVDMVAVQHRKRSMVRELRKVHEDHTEASGAELIYGVARFVGPRTVEIELRDGGTRTIHGDRVFLDLGSCAAIPEVPGLAEATPMTHVEALELDRLPRHLIVLGGGYVGLELSQAFRRFGSEVTVIEHRPQLASREDPDVATALKDLFVDEGIEVVLDAKARRVEGHSANRFRVYVNDTRGDRAIEGTDLLVATGRKANTNGIGLDKTGVQLNERGYIKTNERLETTAENIWAMGDCAGSPQFTHVGLDDHSIVHANLNGGNRTKRNRLIPSDEILGFTAFGFEASELMVAMQTAMLGHLPYTVLRDAILTHPTTSEGLSLLLAKVRSRSATETRVPHSTGEGGWGCSRPRYRMWLGRVAKEAGKRTRG
jgi:pyruvate/2-oxoglutarate dehydrogenase complex dihydrolipoamide dehydrogenase (E3) component